MKTEPLKGTAIPWELVDATYTEVGKADGIIILRKPEITVTRLHLLN